MIDRTNGLAPIDWLRTVHKNSTWLWCEQAVDYAHCVLDLETVDTRPRATVLAIGAYKLDAAGAVIPGSRFYATLDVGLQLILGRTVDPGTVKWWTKQDDEAKNAIFDTQPMTLHQALIEFAAYIEHGRLSKAPWLWGNGTDFDNAILASLYEDAKHITMMNVPWTYRSNADLRTLRKLWSSIDDLEFTGIKHNAADDALHEANGLSYIIQQGLIPNPFAEFIKEQK